MNSKLTVLLFIALLSSCSNESRLDDKILHSVFDTPDGEKFSFSELTGNKFIVLVFYSPECPLCINYTKTLRDLNNKYLNDSVTFVMIFPGRYYTTELIREFRKEYDFRLPAILDPDLKLAKACRASVTPESILMNREGEIFYRGAIDNWSYETGKKKIQPSAQFLSRAIDACLEGQQPLPAITEPVGCFIE